MDTMKLVLYVKEKLKWNMEVAALHKKDNDNNINKIRRRKIWNLKFKLGVNTY